MWGFFMADWAEKKIRDSLIRLLLVFLVSFISSRSLVAAASQIIQPKSQSEQNSQDKTVEEKEVVKSFNEVLQDLVNEFSFDLRAKALNSIRTVAVRRVALGESIPRTYENYIETQISDSVRKHSGTKVLQCTNCRIRRTVVENGRLVTTTPVNNPQELDAIAAQLGVEAWVDASVIYQETSMILGIHVFDSKTKELVWTKIYNTENIYKQKMEQLQTEVEKKEEMEKENVTSYVFNTTLGWHLVPNVKTSASMLAVNLRFAERFNAGRDEVGTRLSLLASPSSIISEYPEISGDPATSAAVVDEGTTEVILPFYRGLAFSAIYSRLLTDDLSQVDGVVWGWESGVGTIISKGYACFSFRTGPHIRMGRRFLLEIGGTYSLPTTLSIRERYKYKTPGGVGADVGFGVQF